MTRKLWSVSGSLPGEVLFEQNDLKTLEVGADAVCTEKTGIFVTKRQRRICSVGKIGMYIAIATLIAMQDVYQSFVFFPPIHPKS